MVLPQDKFENKSSMKIPENSRGRWLFQKLGTSTFKVFLCRRASDPSS